jgi:catechol 2,3-dioxygenase-like lactoylglutathione lyase family enzyme
MAAPTFVVSDVGATVRWYQEHLGFEAYAFPKQEPFVFASVVRDGVEILLLRIEGYQKPDLSPLRPAGLWDAYIRMEGVREFYESLRDKIPIKMPLVRQRYGDTEFKVQDPNGYVLVFSELEQRR